MICFNTCIDLSLANADFTKSMLMGQDFSVMKWMLESGLHHSLLLLTGVRSSFLDIRVTGHQQQRCFLLACTLLQCQISGIAEKSLQLCGSFGDVFFEDLFKW